MNKIIVATAFAATLLASCSSNSSTQQTVEALPFNPPADLSLAVVDGDAHYNYFDRQQWSQMSTQEKDLYTPVGVCLFSENDSIIVALSDVDKSEKMALLSGLAQVNAIPAYKEEKEALANFAGYENCSAMLEENCDPTALDKVRHIEIVNVDSQLWYIPALGQMENIYERLSKLNAAITAFGGEHIANAKYWSSTQCGLSKDNVTFWFIGLKDNYLGMATPATQFRVRPVMDVQP